MDQNQPGEVLNNVAGNAAEPPFYIWANADCANKTEDFEAAKRIRKRLLDQGGEDVYIADANGVEVVDSDIEADEVARSGQRKLEQCRFEVGFSNGDSLMGTCAVGTNGQVRLSPEDEATIDAHWSNPVTGAVVFRAGRKVMLTSTPAGWFLGNDLGVAGSPIREEATESPEQNGVLGNVVEQPDSYKNWFRGTKAPDADDGVYLLRSGKFSRFWLGQWRRPNVDITLAAAEKHIAAFPSPRFRIKPEHAWSEVSDRKLTDVRTLSPEVLRFIETASVSDPLEERMLVLGVPATFNAKEQTVLDAIDQGADVLGCFPMSAFNARLPQTVTAAENSLSAQADCNRWPGKPLESDERAFLEKLYSMYSDPDTHVKPGASGFDTLDAMADAIRCRLT